MLGTEYINDLYQGETTKSNLLDWDLRKPPQTGPSSEMFINTNEQEWQKSPCIWECWKVCSASYFCHNFKVEKIFDRVTQFKKIIFSE